MGPFPFYAYPNFPHSFYASPAEASLYRRPRRPFSQPSSPAPQPAATPRSVINVPVFDSAPSRPSSSPLQSPPAVVPLIDPSSAATKIQSCFRGFCVRRHNPLLHLRSIAKARKHLKLLQSELDRPEFPLKVRTSDKERLRFSESVMAIILRLDAIEGSMAEVRSQRKEATKMAIKLQDAIDAIMMQKDEAPALNSMAEECTGLLRGDAYPVSENSAMDLDTLQEKPLSLEDNAADKCLPDLDNKVVMMMDAENASPSQPCKMEDFTWQTEGGSSCIESLPQVQPAKAMHDAMQDTLHEIGEDAGYDANSAAKEESKNSLHLAEVHEVNSVDGMVDAGAGCVARESIDGACKHVDAVHEGKEGTNEDVALCPITPIAEETCDSPHYSDNAPENELQVKIRRGNELQTPSTSLSKAGASSLQDSAILEQLSGDCRQLRSLVGQLLMQNKAQSKVLCALGERLEMLEHQQQLNCQPKRKRMSEKRKAKKETKRSYKCHNCEC